MSRTFNIDQEIRIRLSAAFHEEAHRLYKAEGGTQKEADFYCARFPEKIQLRPYPAIGYNEFVKLYNDGNVASYTHKIDGVRVDLSRCAPINAQEMYHYLSVDLDKTKRGQLFIELVCAQGYPPQRRYVLWEPEIFNAAQKQTAPAPTAA